jgi:hypothetical protein
VDADRVEASGAREFHASGSPERGRTAEVSAYSLI